MAARLPSVPCVRYTHDDFLLQHSCVIIILYKLERPSSWSTLRICPSWPQSRIELRLSLLYLLSIPLVSRGPPSILLFTPTTQVSMLTLPISQTAQHQRTSKQHGSATSYAHRHTYLHHIHITIHILPYTSSSLFGRPAGLDSSHLTQKQTFYNSSVFGSTMTDRISSASTVLGKAYAKLFQQIIVLQNLTSVQCIPILRYSILLLFHLTKMGQS